LGALSVKNSFQGVYLKTVVFEYMLLYFIQKIALQMYQPSAGFALQMKMFPARRPAVHKLVTGASFIQGVFTQKPAAMKFFQMAVHGCLSNSGLFFPEVRYNLVNGNMLVSQRGKKREDTLALLRTVVCRAFHHSFSMAPAYFLCQPETLH
jgi:hypothetical protein